MWRSSFCCTEDKVNDVGFFIFGQLASLIEIVIVIWFLICFFGWKKAGMQGKIAACGICILHLLTAQMNGSFQGSYIVAILLDAVLLLAFCRIYLQGSLQIQIMGCMIPFLIILIENILIMQVMALLRRMDVHSYMNSTGYGFVAGVVLSKVFLGLVLYWLQKKFARQSIHLSRRYYHIVNAVCIYMVVLEFLLFYVVNEGAYHRRANISLGFIGIGMAVTTAYIGYSIFVISKKNEALLRMELLDVQCQEKERQIQEIKRAGFRENQLIHDYKNHCMCMQKLMEQGNYKEAGNYLSELLGRQVWNKREYVQTECDTLNALLNTKIAYCEEKYIPIHCVITGNLAMIEKIQYMVILFNLLDNAIEASESVEKNVRNIEMKLCCSDNAMELFVKNHITQSVLTKNPELLSDKGKKGHGVGHKSVETSVEELGGMMEYYEEEDEFCVHVFVPFE